jgi:hypothetical protein
LLALAEKDQAALVLALAVAVVLGLAEKAVKEGQEEDLELVLVREAHLCSRRCHYILTRNLNCRGLLIPLVGNFHNLRHHPICSNNKYSLQMHSKSQKTQQACEA